MEANTSTKLVKTKLKFKVVSKNSRQKSSLNSRQKEYNEYNVNEKDRKEINLRNEWASPVNSFKVSNNSKERIKNLSKLNACKKKVDLNISRGLKATSKDSRNNNNSRNFEENNHNEDSNKSEESKIRRSIVNSKHSRRSLSGSNKTKRANSGSLPHKKKESSIKNKDSESKDKGDYFWIPQFPNNMHIAKLLFDWKKLNNSDGKKSREEVQLILKDYIRKFMKITDYHKHFEPTITKIITDYNLISSNGEPNIENLVKLHLRTQKRDNSVSNSESTYYKSRAGSNETRKQPNRIPASSPQENQGKKSNSKKLKIKLKLKKEAEPPLKINLKMGAEKERNKEGSKSVKRAGLVTRRECIGTKKIQHEIPQRGKSEEQRLNELIMNKSEQEDKYDPEEGIIEERENLIAYNKKYFSEHNKIPSTSLEYYRYVKVIGVGAFGVATLGIHKLTGKYVAIKTIKKSLISDEYSKSKLFLEIYILKKIQHSNIIRLLEVFESMKHILLVMEYAKGGDLLHFVRSYGKLPELDSKYIFRQILYGLAHCHWRSVMHRDIKLDNILIDPNGNIKICDFGIAKIVAKGDLVKEQWGTPAYMAPEIMNENGYDAFYPDFWSMGVLLFTLLFGTVPFKAQCMEELHALIQKGEFEVPAGVSQDAQDLIKSLIVVNPKKRITIPEILSHPWFKEICEEDSESAEDDEQKESIQQKIENEIEAQK